MGPAKSTAVFWDSLLCPTTVLVASPFRIKKRYMESTPTATSIVRIQQLPAYQAGGQQQPHFTQGQVIQGSINAKNAPGQFTIDINGQQILAESTAQLAVGQKLDLQVTALAPRVELRIIDNPINRLLGQSIHLLNEQAESFPALASLAAKAQQLPLLNPNSRETLQQYGAAMASLPPSPQQRSLAATVANNTLFDKAITLILNPTGDSAPLLRQEIGTLLNELSQAPQLLPEKMQMAQGLARLFLGSTSFGQLANEPLPASTSLQSGIVLPPEISQLTAGIAQLFPEQPALQTQAATVLTALLQRSDSAQLTPLQSLFALLAQTAPTPDVPATIQKDALQEIMTRLGTNMEQLFAEGKTEEAVRTLKYALLDLSQQPTTDEKAGQRADKLIHTIESYQLLQLRLASEALVFLPLPLPFLKQGYLLINQDQAKPKPDQQADSLAAYELHLQLEGLGNISITFDQRQEGLSLKFIMEDAERARFLAGFRDELAQLVTTAPLTAVQFLVGSQDPIKTLYEKVTQNLSGVLDTTA